MKLKLLTRFLLVGALIAVVTLLVGACSPAQGRSQVIVEGELEKVLPEEYAVYSYLSQALRQDPDLAQDPVPAEDISCRTSTWIGSEDLRLFEDLFPRGYEELPEELKGTVDHAIWQDFLVKNDRPYPLDIPACGSSSSASRFPTQFSRVGFNSEMDQALVYVSNWEGHYRGQGLVFLSKLGGEWSLETTLTVGIYLGIYND